VKFRSIEIFETSISERKGGNPLSLSHKSECNEVMRKERKDEGKEEGEYMN
jgi:hypothetical protein